MVTIHRRFGAPSFGERAHWIEWLLLAALAAAMWIMLPVGSAGAGEPMLMLNGHAMTAAAFGGAPQ